MSKKRRGSRKRWSERYSKKKKKGSNKQPRPLENKERRRPNRRGLLKNRRLKGELWNRRLK
jgi:hypothetical protein